MMNISRDCLNGVLLKLKSGFNDSLSNACVDIGPFAKPFVVDFPLSITDKPTTSFLLGKLSEADIDACGIVRPSFMVLWCDGLADTKNEKMRDFAGTVIVRLDLYITWPASANVNQMNFEALRLACESAVAECIQPYQLDNWGTGVVYNGDFSCGMGDVEAIGDSGWRQRLSFRFSFGMFV